MKELQRKMCVVGDAAVGKTSLISKFVTGRYSEKYMATLGGVVSKKDVKIKKDDVKGYSDDNIELELVIWDIAGQKKFGDVPRSFYNNADGAFVVVDLTDEKTLESARYWIEKLNEINKYVPIIILANKCDLDKNQWESDTDDIRKVSLEYKSPHFVTSAATGENVEKAFTTLARRMITEYATIEAARIENRREWMQTPAGIIGSMGIPTKLKPNEAFGLIRNIMAHVYLTTAESVGIGHAVVRKQLENLGLWHKFSDEAPDFSKKDITRLVEGVISAMDVQHPEDDVGRQARLKLMQIKNRVE